MSMLQGRSRRKYKYIGKLLLTMRFSIITPTLNSEKYIDDNLKSIHLDQSGDFEIEQIIVDGGSIDGTIEIVENFRQENAVDITILQGKDKNMYDAINKGLHAMNGDIWACLNSDDFYNKEVLNVVAVEFEKDPEIDAVYGNLDLIDNHGNRLRTWYLPKLNIRTFVIHGPRNFLYILHPSTFLRKRTLSKVGYFDLDYKYASDYDYLIRVAKRCAVQHIPKSFTRFRLHADSASGSNDENLNNTFQSESEAISKKYALKFGFSERNQLYSLIAYRLAQIHIDNARSLILNNRISKKLLR